MDIKVVPGMNTITVSGKVRVNDMYGTLSLSLSVSHTYTDDHTRFISTSSNDIKSRSISFLSYGSYGNKLLLIFYQTKYISVLL